MKPEQWSKLMKNMGFSANTETYEKLVECYSKKKRFYHTCEHVAACLEQLDCVSEHLDHPYELELAIWFHDAVYKPLSKNNEKQSAMWAVKFMQANGAEESKVYRVESLIMCTVHGTLVSTHDESYLVDIDLSILGAERTKFQIYAENVRREYAMIPSLMFNSKRKAMLQEFLSRDSIYLTEHFVEQYEQRARENLAYAIERL